MIVVGIALVGNAHAQLLDTLALDTAKTYFSLEAALKNPDRVYKLKLNKKKLTEFPQEILQLKNLNYLEVEKNKIKEIPNEIGQLQYLQHVSFSKNKIATFPKGLCELKHLKNLILNQNEIDGLPKEIGQLTALERLDMWSNDLGDFPDELGELKETLKWMDLRVILISFDEQKRIHELLPKSKIYIDPACNCNF